MARQSRRMYRPQVGHDPAAGSTIRTLFIIAGPETVAPARSVR